MTRIVTTRYRYKRPAGKRKAVAHEVPAPMVTRSQPPPRDWDFPTVQEGELPRIVLSDPRWNTAPLRPDGPADWPPNVYQIHVANHVACRRCGAPAGEPCFSTSRGVRVVPERRLQFSHEDRLILYVRLPDGTG
jgi:hypothetical protein